MPAVDDPGGVGAAGSDRDAGRRGRFPRGGHRAGRGVGADGPVVAGARYARGGLAALSDAARSGRPKTVDDRKTVEAMSRPPPKKRKRGVPLIGSYLAHRRTRSCCAWSWGHPPVPGPGESPGSTDLPALSREDVDAIAAKLNHRSLRVLAWATPTQTLEHFQPAPFAAGESPAWRGEDHDPHGRQRTSRARPAPVIAGHAQPPDLHPDRRKPSRTEFATRGSDASLLISLTGLHRVGHELERTPPGPVTRP